MKLIIQVIACTLLKQFLSANSIVSFADNQLEISRETTKKWRSDHEYNFIAILDWRVVCIGTSVHTYVCTYVTYKGAPLLITHIRQTACVKICKVNAKLFPQTYFQDEYSRFGRGEVGIGTKTEKTKLFKSPKILYVYGKVCERIQSHRQRSLNIL